MSDHKDDLEDRRLKPGRHYVVEINDCCVSGRFQSVLEAVVYCDDDPDYLDTTCWANGVQLTNHDGVSMNLIYQQGELQA